MDKLLEINTEFKYVAKEFGKIPIVIIRIAVGFLACNGLCAVIHIDKLTDIVLKVYCIIAVADLAYNLVAGISREIALIRWQLASSRKFSKWINSLYEDTSIEKLNIIKVVKETNSHSMFINALANIDVIAGLNNRDTVSIWARQLRNNRETIEKNEVAYNSLVDKIVESKEYINSDLMHKLTKVNERIKSITYYERALRITIELYCDNLMKIITLTENTLEAASRRFENREWAGQNESVDMNEYERAKCLFMLDDKYTLDELKTQRNRLLKAFHPDNTHDSSDKYIDRINRSYEILKRGR